MAALPRYIQRRNHRLYAVLEIPKDVQRHYPGSRPGSSKKRLLRSLETDALSTANRRIGPIISQWKAEFARLRDEPNDDAAYFRKALAEAKTDQDRAALMDRISLEHSNLSSPAIPSAPGIEPSPEYIEGAQEAALAIADDFAARATGQIVGFTDLMDAWIASPHCTAQQEKTRDEYRFSLRQFSEVCPTVQDVTPERIQDWIDGSEIALATLNKRLSALKGYWKYLQLANVKVVPKGYKPFDDVDKPKRRSNGEPSRLPFTREEIVRLRLASMKDQQLHRLITLAMFTGARIEELCSLKLEAVHPDHFDIIDSKDKWLRQVPIHHEIERHVSNMVKASKDGYLITGLTLNKYGDRSNAIGKRFGRLKTQLGYGKQHVFHSIRKTVITRLENAKQPENVVADIVGHEKNTMTYGLYSGGSSMALKAEVLAKLSYRAV